VLLPRSLWRRCGTAVQAHNTTLHRCVGASHGRGVHVAAVLRSGIDTKTRRRFRRRGAAGVHWHRSWTDWVNELRSERFATSETAEAGAGRRQIDVATGRFRSSPCETFHEIVESPMNSSNPETGTAWFPAWRFAPYRESAGQHPAPLYTRNQAENPLSRTSSVCGDLTTEHESRRPSSQSGQHRDAFHFAFPMGAGHQTSPTDERDGILQSHKRWVRSVGCSHPFNLRLECRVTISRNKAPRPLHQETRVRTSWRRQQLSSVELAISQRSKARHSRMSH
jgi:hypothetical protein